MITIYGIPNCDTVQKAIKWLNTNNIKFRFHNFREDGLEDKSIEYWLTFQPLNKLINTRSTTFRDLGEKGKGALDDPKKAIALMKEYPSIIKRPVWDMGKDGVFLGWDEQAMAQLLNVK